MLRIQQFAKLANVTVRTLHHYDRLGLFPAQHRSPSGYRLYLLEDLAQLERILVLRYLGIPLREIAALLTHPSSAHHQSLAETLDRQTAVLRERRNGIDRVLTAIANARQNLNQQHQPDWNLYQSILKEIHMQENQDWTAKYYSPESQQTIDQNRQNWNPELQAKVTADWQQIYADVQSALDRGVTPTSPEGHALADRWMALVGAFTGGNLQVLDGLNKLYADRANWPAGKVNPEIQQNMPKPEYMAFVRAARQK